jgi:hypothetical protein
VTPNKVKTKPIRTVVKKPKEGALKRFSPIARPQRFQGVF